MIRLLAALLFAGTALPLAAQPAPAYTPSLTRLLRSVVTTEGRVHYERLTDGPQRVRLDSLVEVLATYPLPALSTDAEKHAFWINAYNVLMLDAVARHPDRSNVLGNDGGAVFFKHPRRVGGLDLTLDQIEHVLLRRQEGPAALMPNRVRRLDPRIHVALNCAAVSCPRLQREAFQPDRLDAQLDAAMRAFVNSPLHFSYRNGVAHLSSLVDWFGDDFEQQEPVGTYLLRYLDADRPDAYGLRGLLDGARGAALRELARKARPRVVFEYDWTVNRASPHR